MAEIVEGGEEVDAAGGVVLQVFVFDGDLVIAQGLFSFGLRGDGGEEGRPRRSVGCVCACLLYTSPSPRDAHESRMPSSA